MRWRYELGLAALVIRLDSGVVVALRGGGHVSGTAWEDDRSGHEVSARDGPWDLKRSVSINCHPQ